MSTSTALPDLRTTASAFALYGRYVTGASHGSGHINDTYVVEFDQAGVRVRYLLQRVNHRVFKDVPGLMDNIRRVCAHAATKAANGDGRTDSRRCLVLVPTRQGLPCHQDEAGSWWRCYLFIEGARTHDLIEHPGQAREAARAFGAFQNLLADLPGARLHETIPDFHHTRRRFDSLRAAIASDRNNRAARARSEIAFALAQEKLVDVLLDLQARGELPERVTHNDTKLNNVMIDNATGEGLCVIDLDTVMPGLALYDFGDMVRSATNSTAEDDPDPAQVKARLPVFEALVEGYLASAGAFLTNAERAHLAFSGRLITFEIGIRFLTDFLDGDVYFKTKRPEHNLDRARNQFALVHSLEAQQSVMEAFVQRQPRP